MQTSNALEKAKQLIAGRMDYDVLCRHAAHNLAERTQLQLALKEKVSKPRLIYLKSKMKDLMIEKSLLETKEGRIKPFVTSDHKFII